MPSDNSLYICHLLFTHFAIYKKSECICQVIIAFIFATFFLGIFPNIRKGPHGQQSPPFLMQKFSPSHINKLRINLYIQDISSRNFNHHKHKMLNFHAMLIRKHQTKLETNLINQTCETKFEETNLSDKPNL